MKKIGIVGGVAWQSTVEYYRLICEWANAHHRALGTEPPLPTPPMSIESLVMHETRGLRAQPSDDDAAWAAYDATFRDALLRLERMGCSVALIANNTCHTRFEPITRGVAMPVISILDASATAAAAAGAKRALVLGTSVTMRSDAYTWALVARNVDTLPRLSEESIDSVQDLIDTEFARGGTKRGRAALIELCEQHVETPQETAVLLACTELPLAFPEHADNPVFESDGYLFVNTVAAHARAAFEAAID